MKPPTQAPIHVPALTQVVCDGRAVPVRLERQPAAAGWTARLAESPAVAFTGADAAEALSDLTRFMTTRARYAEWHGI